MLEVNYNFELTLDKSYRREFVKFSDLLSKQIDTQYATKDSSIRPKPFNANALR